MRYEGANMISLHEFLNFQSQVQFVLNQDILPDETKESMKRLLKFEPNSKANKVAREYLASVSEAADSFLTYKQLLKMCLMFLSSSEKFKSKEMIPKFLLDNFHLICNQAAIHNYIQYYQSIGNPLHKKQPTHPTLFLLRSVINFSVIKKPTQTDKELFEQYFQDFLKSLDESEETINELMKNVNQVEELPPIKFGVSEDLELTETNSFSQDNSQGGEDPPKFDRNLESEDEIRNFDMFSDKSNASE